MGNAQKKFSWEDSNLLDDIRFQDIEAKEFQKLLAAKEESPEAPGTSTTPGTLLVGRVVEITKDFVVIDVGLKSEGLVPIAEFIQPEELGLGNDIEVMLEEPEDEHGQIVLSREKARRQRQWEYIVEHCEEGSIVSGRVSRKVKGGLMVDIGMEAFLPGSQLDNKRIKNLDEYLGKNFDFKILKINIDRKNVVVSRREVIESERQSKRAELLEQMQVGDIVKGTVKNITDFGVFLDLDGIDGLLHVTDMTWRRIRHPSEMVQLGDELEVIVLNVDHDKGRVALGLKQKELNPWLAIERKYPTGTLVTGKIVSLVPYGAFVELEPGIEGLIHISEMAWTNVTDPKQVVTQDQEVKAVVLSVQTDEGKISLGLKQAMRNPWEDADEKYPIDTVVSAEVRSLTNYGAFVELEPGVDGLIHISDMSWTKKVSHPSELLKKGDPVKAIVLTNDKESRKITLGMKQLTEDPWESIERTVPVNSIVEGTVSKIAAFGIFLELDNGLEALVHVTEVSAERFDSIDRLYKLGDRVKAKVLRIDRDHKKIAVSIKECGSQQSDDIVVTDSDEEIQH